MADTITNAIDFLEKIKSEKVVTIKFIKQDGTIRIMRCTLDFTLIPDEKKPKTFDFVRILKEMKNSGILRIFDVEKEEWRSVKFQSVEWLETSTKIYNISPMG